MALAGCGRRNTQAGTGKVARQERSWDSAASVPQLWELGRAPHRLATAGPSPCCLSGSSGAGGRGGLGGAGVASAGGEAAVRTCNNPRDGSSARACRPARQSPWPARCCARIAGAESARARGIETGLASLGLLVCLASRQPVAAHTQVVLQNGRAQNLQAMRAGKLPRPETNTATPQINTTQHAGATPSNLRTSSPPTLLSSQCRSPKAQSRRQKDRAREEERSQRWSRPCFDRCAPAAST